MGKPAYSWFWLLFLLIGITTPVARADSTTSPKHIGYYCAPETQSIVEGQYYEHAGEPCVYSSNSLGFGFRYGAIFHGAVGSSTQVVGHSLGSNELVTEFFDRNVYLLRGIKPGEEMFVAIFQLRAGPAFENDQQYFRDYFEGRRPEPPHYNFGFIRYIYGREPETEGCTEECNSNVLFLPGIQSSRLYRPDYSGGTEKLWEPGGVSDVEDMYLLPSGSSIRDDVYTKEGHVLDELPITQQNIYESFLNDLDAWKNFEGIIEDYSVVAYDWRLSLNDILTYGNLIEDRLYYSGIHRATSTPYVLQELRRLAATSRNGKVTIVAHSNGGLVAKALIKQLQDTNDPLLESIDNLVLIAVPQLGTPQALGALLHGYDQALPFSWLPLLVTPEHARAFASTSPMAYHLLPSEAYFNASGPIITFEPGEATQPFIDAYGESIDSYEEFESFLLNMEGRTEPAFEDVTSPASADPELLSYAQDVHLELDSWIPPVSMRVTEIAGWGEETLAGIKYSSRLECVEKNLSGGCMSHQPTLIYSPVTNSNGDGTVVSSSATFGLDHRLNTSTFWMDLRKYNSRIVNDLTFGFLTRDHKNITEIEDLRKQVLNLVKASEDIEYEYLYSNMPTSVNETYLKFILHSPLDISVSDSQQRKTSKDLSNIPGSIYREYGEVKMIKVPSSGNISLQLVGRGEGSFTLEVISQFGELVNASSTFTGIPSSKDLIASMEIVDGSIQNAGDLLIDNNGDGVPELSLKPRVGEIVAPDITPPVTIPVVDGKKGKNDWYVESVDVKFTVPEYDSVQTFFSLDGQATTSGTSTKILNEGQHVLRYFSVDSVGNEEPAKEIQIKIDKQAPEALVQADLVSRDLSVLGNDQYSSTTVTRLGNIYTIVDEAGNVTTLEFQKTYSKGVLTYARLQSVKYGDAEPIQIPSSFLFIWNTKATIPLLISQTLTLDGQMLIEALYDAPKNTTKIIVLKKRVPIQLKILKGMARLKLETENGQINYSW